MRLVPFLFSTTLLVLSFTAGAAPLSIDTQLTAQNPKQDVTSGMMNITCTWCAVNSSPVGVKPGEEMFGDAPILPAGERSNSPSQNGKTSQ